MEGSTKLRVRPATGADVPAAARMIADHRQEDVRLWTERLALDLADPERIFLVAEVAGEVVGFGQARVTENPDNHPLLPPSGWYLSGMTVAPAWRRRGIGEALTRGRLELLAGQATRVHYLADPENIATIALHAKLGFTRTHLVSLDAEDRPLAHYQLDLPRG
jgi:ribosomal protein S18 acetylase RimI-like enzyme